MGQKDVACRIFLQNSSIVMGNVISKFSIKEYTKEREKFISEMEKEQRKCEEFEQSTSYTLMRYAKSYDDWFLDPIVGFFIPGFGDLLSSAASIPALHVAIFKLKSFTLTIAILSCTLIDLIVGAIPIFGDIVDAFYKSNKRAYRLVVGYYEDDPETKSEINKRAFTGCIILAIIGLLIWGFYELIIGIYHWLANLF